MKTEGRETIAEGGRPSYRDVGEAQAQAQARVASGLVRHSLFVLRHSSLGFRALLLALAVQYRIQGLTRFLLVQEAAGMIGG
jgi:hypothetical protein